MLLPRPQLDEDGNEVDPREDLVQKLLEYKRFKAILPLLQQLEDDRQQQEKRGNIVRELAMVGKQNNPGEELTTLDLYKLLKINEKVLKSYQLQNEEVVHTVVQYPYTIREKQDIILKIGRASSKERECQYV